MGVATQQEDSYLVLLDGDGAVVKQFARSQGKITLGRASKNDPGTLDPSQGKFRSDSTKVMSSRHAQISWEGDYAYITDLDSTNGVLVTRDEERVSLKPGVAYRVSGPPSQWFRALGPDSSHVVHADLRGRPSYVRQASLGALDGRR